MLQQQSNKSAAERGATLVLSDGTRYRGKSFGAEHSVGGECVFQTGMVGYVESLTDPSYRGQLLVLSYPLIGNYGAPPEDVVDEYGLSKFMESEQVHISALIVADYSAHFSHWNAHQSLGDWLKAHDVPAIHSIDTRALIKKIRDTGSMLAKIVLDGDDEESVKLEDPNQRHLVAEVSRKQPQTYGNGSINVVAVDCGMKNNQVRCFLKRGVKVKVVPWDWPLLEEKDAHGFFLSNGPGDPTFCQKTIENVRALLARESAKEDPIPVFGICLGNQIMGLAAGASTYKLKFGNRGHNQPCVDVNTERCHLTSQNHGFAIDSATLPEGWKELFYNANDRTNEGIQHLSKPFFSCQFHPEAKGGPWDTEYLFDAFLSKITKRTVDLPMSRPSPPKAEHLLKDKVHKVLILGSGGLSIGQAGEFDYSGSQAIKALKQEHIQTVLINPNIATVQTSPGLADKVYFLPVTPEFVVKLIEWERPDGILLTFGGQTALNCGIELYKQRVFEKYKVRVMGTPLEAIIATEDREVFAQELLKINEKIAPSVAARSLDEALKAADKIGYPVVVRAGFALGGLGSGFANDTEELRKLATMAFAQSEQVLVEKSLKGWKEIEYEVVRDAYDNCVTVCNMENFDPLGIHTGESIVVAPSQTLSDQDYFMLRDVAIRVVRHLGIVGECNIQYALSPDSEEYFIIEVNARLSRSSALASKATGYPLAFVAAKLALGVPLPSLRNAVTKTTTACWEPSLDYVVVKMPRWDLQKFQKVDGQIGTSMKSVGEVMAIGRTFEETIQKAIRMVNGSQWDGFQSGLAPASSEALTNPSSNRILVIAQALHEGLGVEEIHQLTKIDRWFLHKLKGLSDYEKMLRRLEGGLHHGLLLQAKQLGFADKQIAKFLNSTELVVRKTRKEFNILPKVKQIDTVAAEFPAYNNYLYLTYNGVEDDIETPVGPAAVDAADPAAAVANAKADEAERSIIVLGSGAYCIGSSVEFDYCAVRCAQTLKKLGKPTIMINYNPETVSTDYDECDKLYFEELSFERVVDIYEKEQAAGVVVSMGGQIPNNMSMALGRQGVRILGTTPEMIESSENRFKFSRMLDLEGVDQPTWKDCSNFEDTKRFCEEVGYPCLVRPSFVLSGAGMTVVNNAVELETYLTLASTISTGKEQRVVISKFIMNAKEVDLDAVAQDGELIAVAISEHVENAGVHSGDATLVLPAQDLDQITVRKIEQAARKIAKQLQVSGPFNMQFIAKDNEIKVIECNLRASRSFPFVSKTLGIDFIELATKALLGLPLSPQPLPKINHVGVKVPQFSFSRLPGADPVLGVEMASTGEVACFGKNKYEAYMKALLSTGFKLPKKRNIFLSLGPYKEKLEFLDSAQKLVNMGYNLFGTVGTADFLSEHSIPIKSLNWDQEAEQSDLETLSAHLAAAKIDLCIILPSNNRNRRPASFMSKGYMARRLAVDYSVPLITNIKCAKLFIECLRVVPANIPIGLVDCRASSRTVILPGLIDVHVHMREPGAAHKEDWDTGTAAALAGGFTMVCAMPNTNPEVIDAASMDLVTSIAKSKARCDYGLYFGASSTNARAGAQFASQAVALKMYLNQTFTNLRLDDMTTWMEHFTHWPRELPIVVHAEATTMAAALMVATLHDRPLHIAHVCLKEELAIIRAAKDKGIRVTCEVCPHHLYLDKDINTTACDHHHHLTDSRKEVRPRLASKVDVEALWANMDIIDCIATDHAPHTLAEKDGPHPPPGFPGLETALPLMLTAVNQGRITLDDLIAKMYTNPKRIFNLPDQEDTYVVVDMDEEWTVPEAMAHSKCGWTPFAGMRLQGRAVRVVLRGKTAMLDGAVYALPGDGRNVCSARTRLPPAPTATALTPPTPTPTPTLTTTGAVTAATSAQVAVSSPSPAPSPAFHRPAAAAIVTPPAIRRVASGAQPRLAVASAEQQGAVVGVPERRNSVLSQEIFTHAGALPPRFTAKHVTSVKQFTRDDLRYLFSVAHDMRMMVKRVGSWDLLKGKVLANVFYEPSTRTSSSFQAAMLRLGGSVISVNESSSSVVKGESLPDTIRTLECYSDIIVLRHPQAGAAQLAASHARVPIINAGDGIGEHPTQALLDAFTIREELGTVNGLRITMVGDLKNGRTVHSLVRLLSLYSIAQLNYVSPSSLKMPTSILEEMDKKGIPQRECGSLEEVLPHTDVLYVTRIQKERFASEEEYLAVKGTYVITPELLSHAKSDLVIMHPLPRVDEISPEIDSDPRAAYFRQMENGMYIRMALLATILSSSFSS